jgi:hypothetical protein
MRNKFTILLFEESITKILLEFQDFFSFTLVECQELFFLLYVEFHGINLYFINYSNQSLLEFHAIFYDHLSAIN